MLTEVMVGRVGRAHGIRGEVSIELYTDEPDRRFAVGAVLRVNPSSRPVLTVAAARPHGERLLVAFAEITDRTGAESLRGAALRVEVEPRDRPDGDEEFYDHQLVGLSVRTAAGRSVGTVTDVRHLPLQDLLTIAVHGVHEPVLVPFVSALVPEVDLAGGGIVVADLPGLLDDAES